MIFSLREKCNNLHSFTKDQAQKYKYEKKMFEKELLLAQNKYQAIRGKYENAKKWKHQSGAEDQD